MDSYICGKCGSDNIVYFPTGGNSDYYCKDCNSRKIISTKIKGEN